VKPLAFGQYGELGPGFEQLLDQLAEEGAGESAKRHLIPSRVVAKGVQAAPTAAAAAGGGGVVVGAVMTARTRHMQMCPPPTASTTHYRGRTPRRRGAIRKTSSTAAQPRQAHGLTAASMRTTALASAERAARKIRGGRAGPREWGQK
jgi:hypothetical protein